MVNGLKAPDETLPSGFVITNTIASLLVQAWFIFLTLFFQFLRATATIPSSQDSFARIGAIAGLAAAISLPWALLALWRLFRHGTPERSIREIGRAVVEALQYEGSIDSTAQMPVYANRNDDGTVFCWVGESSGKDQAAFLLLLRRYSDRSKIPGICWPANVCGVCFGRTISPCRTALREKKNLRSSLRRSGVAWSALCSWFIREPQRAGGYCFEHECTHSPARSKRGRSA